MTEIEFMNACLEDGNYWISQKSMLDGAERFYICFDIKGDCYWLTMAAVGCYQLKICSEEERQLQINQIKSRAAEAKAKILELRSGDRTP